MACSSNHLSVWRRNGCVCPEGSPIYKPEHMASSTSQTNSNPSVSLRRGWYLTGIQQVPTQEKERRERTESANKAGSPWFPQVGSRNQDYQDFALHRYCQDSFAMSSNDNSRCVTVRAKASLRGEIDRRTAVVYGPNTGAGIGAKEPHW